MEFVSFEMYIRNCTLAIKERERKKLLAWMPCGFHPLHFSISDNNWLPPFGCDCVRYGFSIHSPKWIRYLSLCFWTVSLLISSCFSVPPLLWLLSLHFDYNRTNTHLLLIYLFIILEYLIWRQKREWNQFSFDEKCRVHTAKPTKESERDGRRENFINFNLINTLGTANVNKFFKTKVHFF